VDAAASARRSARAASSAARIASGVLLAVLALPAAQAEQPIAPPTCALRLTVEVTLDVPHPTDGGFISSLLGDHAGYSLYLIQGVDDSHVILQLQGPGPMERCQAVVDAMRQDGRVQAIDVG
jgi:hypothetical protein